MTSFDKWRDEEMMRLLEQGNPSPGELCRSAYNAGRADVIEWVDKIIAEILKERGGPAAHSVWQAACRDISERIKKEIP